MKKIKRKSFASIIVPVLSLTIFMTAAPALALGPENAFDVGNNPNLWIGGGALHNNRGEALGNVLWYSSSGVDGKWLFFDPTSGQGKMNNAIIADMATLSQFSADSTAFKTGNLTVNENKWIFLSPEGSGNQYQFPDTPQTHALYLLGSHGILWWLFYLGFGHSTALANQVAAQYPNGVFWNYNFVKMT